MKTFFNPSCIHPPLRAAACLVLAAAALAHASLRDLAAPYGVRIGSMINREQATEDAVYSLTAQAQLNFMTIAQQMTSMQPQSNVFNFSTADRLLQFAQQNGFPVRFHALVYGKYVPQWVLDLTNTWTQAQAEAILSNYITTVCQHFAGKVFCYDVVNENFWDDGSWRSHPWLDGIGSNYVELAFRWARAADTNALLFYNDNKCEQINTKSTHILNFLTNLRARGVTVHGLGSQCHIVNGDYATGYGSLPANLDRYGALGLRVHITELDCRLSTNDGPTTAQFDLQYSNFYHFVRGVLASTNRENITMWGFSDNYSWLQPGSPYMQGLWGWPCPYDYFVRPKPAYFGFRNALLPVLDEFLFNGNGTTASNTGMALRPVTLYNASGAPADLHGGPYSGAGGGLYNRAFNNSGASGMGAGFSGGLASHTAPSTLAGLHAFTLCGWFYANSAPANSACLVATADANTFKLDAPSTGNLRLSLNGASAASTGAPFAFANQWVFFALTYTNSSNNNLLFYRGLLDAPLQHVATLSLPAGPVSNSASGLCIGNISARSQPFRGWLDNLRICSGVLSIGILETLRSADARDQFPLIAAYNFNETGTTASNTGFTTAPFALTAAGGAPADLHSAPGTGVSPFPHDRALDTRTATGMGTGFTGPRAAHTADYGGFDRLRSFTVCAWLNPSSPLRDFARIFDNGFDGRLMAAAGANSNDLRFAISNTVVETTGDLFAGTGTWLFVAVAADGTRTSNNIFFYKGTLNTPVVCVTTASLPMLVQSDTANLYLANNMSYNAPFRGLMDNVRFYGTRYDDAAVLSLSRLEELRAQDAVPEPALLAALLLFTCLRARRA